ncbi:alpha-amylase family glycosyl hydrolase [Ructibacterium gallinarum]|uniref:Glycosyl hydrolase family 13 catalytic domain-containing protein n=1 Tax=Ructibacterium gallinarum TaxID=2779355 RepID=A0A9D5M140_9FIRM|nr:alpha-amylase family glycosyl hydrolase [Ructibacterium gallinarum]MBE5040702.1 hypothetical protein [Ructibacterium gallinarum]
MWAYESVFYQIYPMGFCGAPQHNDGIPVSRIRKLKDWIPHMKKIGIDALYLSPVFESDSHGYDTRDFRKIDTRLGSNEDFKEICSILHQNRIRIVLDGVFHHVGRGFWAFQDVLKKREHSRYKDWFYLDFCRDSVYQDGFWYEGWEGHFELVKLNLANEEVVEHIFSCVKEWIQEFDIDGLRLDVAYSLRQEFLRRLRLLCDELKPEFFLIGELLHGDYNQFVSDQLLHSCTNYECYKGLYSSFNSMNMFEITHSLLRQFGPEPWTLYKGKHLLCFVDNHDVSRIASVLSCPEHLPLIYALLFGMPGIPCIYYGSEWGVKGEKKAGSDIDLRPYFDTPQENALTEWISQLSKIHKNSVALCYGSFRQVLLTNRQVIFERKTENERILVGINADNQSFEAHFDAGCGRAEELLTGKMHDFGGGSILPPYGAVYWRMER